MQAKAGRAAAVHHTPIMKQEAPDSNGVEESEAAIPASRSFSAGQVVFECRPFVAVLDRKWKFSVSLSVRGACYAHRQHLGHLRRLVCSPTDKILSTPNELSSWYFD